MPLWTLLLEAENRLNKKVWFHLSEKNAVQWMNRELIVIELDSVNDLTSYLTKYIISTVLWVYWLSFYVPFSSKLEQNKIKYER